MTETLEPDFRRVHPLSPFLRVGIFVVAGVVATWQQVVREELQPIRLLLTVLVVVVAGLVYGFLAWWFTRYRIDAEELRIDSGAVMRRSRRISIERLQSVDVVQPLVARLFGMAELRFEVAGGSRTEAPLAYLRLEEAHRLRGVLLDREVVQATDEPPAAEVTEAWRPEHEIARVDPTWLVGGTVLSTEFVVSVLVALLAMIATVSFREAAALALVLPAVLGAGSVLFRGVVNQWGFVLSDTGRGWRLRQGLFDLRSQTVPLDRVQGIALVEPVLWRRLGWVKVQVDVAGYSGSSSQGKVSTSTLLPVAPRPLALAVVARLLPGGSVTQVVQRPVPRAARLFRPVGWRYLGVGADQNVVVTTLGWVQRRTDIVPHRKTQSIRVRQGPLQRRLGLVDVRFQTTPGPVDAVARHRPVAELPEWVTDQLERAARARRPAERG
ncbi:MAG: PH domain-containing protein [Nocardioidaceae bacterium]